MARQPQDAGNGKRHSVLVMAEDEEATLPYASLTFQGESVGRFSGGGEVVRCVQAYEAEIILIDCGCNSAWGICSLKQLKEAFPDIPVILLTDIGSEEMAVNAFRAGACDYFRKPVDIRELRAVILGFLKAKRSSREKRRPILRVRERGSAGNAKPAIGKTPMSVVRALGYIEENLACDISLDKLASAACLSKHHFCRIFKKGTGLNPMQFVMTARVERVKEILRQADVGMSTVANKTGFRDISTFNRQFKRQTGMTPSSYRDTLI